KLSELVGEQVRSTLPMAVWISPDRVPVQGLDAFRGWATDLQRVAEWIEFQLAEMGMPLSHDGGYSARVLNDSRDGRLGILVSHVPRENISWLKECLKTTKLLVPRAFKKPLLATAALPCEKKKLVAVEISSGDLIDPNAFSDVVDLPESIAASRQAVRESG